MKLDELEAKYEELGKEIEKLKNQKVESKKRWRAEYSGYYFYAGSDGICYKEFDMLNDKNNFRYQTGNYFETKEQAERHQAKQILLQKYADFIDEINEEPVDWRNQMQSKYILIYNCYSLTIEYIGVSYNHIQGVLYTTNPKLVELVKQRFTDEELKIILGVTK